MRRVVVVAATLVGFVGVFGGGSARAQEPDRACMADAARLCAGVEPGGGAQVECLKAHKDELSPACKKKVVQMKVKQMERQELQKQQMQQPPQ
jgi:hypothetical protein